MLRPASQLGLFVAGALLLSGCAAVRPAQTAAAPMAPAAAPSMPPGMVLADGSMMHAIGAAGPSASARMICAQETRSDLAKILALKAAPTPTATWVDHLYTCSYRLPMGRLVLSVKEAGDAASTGTYFAALQHRLGATSPLAGLTAAAFGTADGTVVLRKDNDVLRVDATGLPAQFGTQQQKRTDFAYEVASNILGCWTGD